VVFPEPEPPAIPTVSRTISNPSFASVRGVQDRGAFARILD
jgi:hypothetical protein